MHPVDAQNATDPGTGRPRATPEELEAWRRSTLIVMPALNEEGAIASVIAEIHSVIPGIRVLVVNDGSLDRTAEVARSAGALVADLPYNMGVGAAMRVGFNYARAYGISNVVQIDSDGQHDPGDLPAILRGLEHHDIVIGSRFVTRTAYEVRGPRKWAMKVMSMTISRLAKHPVTDTTSGYKASGPRAVELFALHYPAEYLGDTIEALVIAARSGLTMTEVTAHMRVRQAGVPSHNPVKSAIYLGRAFIALAFAQIRSKKTFEVHGA